MQKFQNLVDEAIDKESLSQIYGGSIPDEKDTDEGNYACEQHACSNNIDAVKGLCDNGVCQHHAD